MTAINGSQLSLTKHITIALPLMM